MLINSSQFNRLFEAVSIDKHQSDDRTILVFVANNNVDSICAVRQLQDIFQQDELPFSEVPVESYEEILEGCASIKDTEELKTIFLINCGATEDVRLKCDLANENIRIVIIDSHRPIWHGHKEDSDVGGRNTLVFLDEDDPVPAAHIPDYREHDKELLADPEAYLSTPRRPQRGPDSEEDEDEHDGASPSKRQRRTLDEESLRRRELLQAYYETKSGFGKPSSLLLYHLACKTGHDKTLSLWLGILGLTDQLVHQRISRQHYNKWKRMIEVDLPRHTGVAAPLQDNTNSLQQRHDTLAIAKIDDIGLTMLKDWTLHDSLQFSPYTASRMQTWTEKGRANTKLMLAKMSIPPDQSNACYKNMKSQHRESLIRRLQDHGPNFGLNMRSLMVEGFEIRFKSCVRLSASDMVAMMTATLGMPRKDATEAKMGFHDAGDILRMLEKDVPKLEVSKERVKHINKVIVTQGGLAISRNQVLGSRRSKFWHLDLSALDFMHKQDFCHPTMLHCLAIFLRDAMSRRYNTTKAMVLVGPPGTDDHCYVVALRAKEASGVLQNNPFARPFEDVRKSLDISLPLSTFDSSLYYIRRTDAGAFLEELKVIIANYESDAHVAAQKAAA